MSPTNASLLSAQTGITLSYMRHIKSTFTLLVVVVGIAVKAEQVPARKIACKTTHNASSCYWTHGRLSYYNGTPAIRVWRIGTNRLLGIYSGPTVNRRGLDNENPELPANVAKSFNPTKNRIFGDFEVCPLEPERNGTMQAACVASAKNLSVSAF